ncbi:MAG: sigma-70 family RNA polymerase sigma factor [Firmicutes bacterium]|nr:sigma-70 family RNA polymerase sigma factor [Bacillota bacterium]
MKKEKFNRLLAKCRSPETFRAAYTELYDFFFHRIVLHISYKYKNPYIGEDIAQSFFVKLMQLNITYKIDNPLSWVLTSCDNLAKDYFECDSRNRIMPPQNATDSHSIDPLQKAIFGEYEEKLNRLDPVTREIITMKIFSGYDLKEIADELQITHSSARQKYSRGLKMLK